MKKALSILIAVSLFIGVFIIPGAAQEPREALNAALSYLAENTPEPKLGSGFDNDEWTIMALARGNFNVLGNYFRSYLDDVIKTLKDSNGVLQSTTDYSRLIIALTSIGVNVTDAGGYNLLTHLASFDDVVSQGISGAIFALLALDTKNWVIPVISDGEKQATRQKYVEYILGNELSGGGFNWGFGDDVDPDLTSMVLQALAPYKSQSNVSTAADRALAALSSIQLDNGGFESWGIQTAESAAQVVTALTALGINPVTDSRFVKADGNPVSALLAFREQNGGFTFGGEVNRISTEQAAYALAAYDRFVNGRNRLYDMTDVTRITTPTPPPGSGKVIKRPSGGGSSVLVPEPTPTTPPPAPQAPEEPIKFTTADALNVLRHIAGIKPLTSEQRARYGLTSGINTADALNILRIIAGL
ncbi:MAG: terpene cyclase/mutase family protein [Oscillospiraceae bacterium]|nr:terpene cyclase/mutase family protein [Oscillospiraceae bacterium]